MPSSPFQAEGHLEGMATHFQWIIHQFARLCNFICRRTELKRAGGRTARNKRKAVMPNKSTPAFPLICLPIHHASRLSMALMNRCAISKGLVIAPPTITAQTPMSSICTASSGVCTRPSPMTGMGRSPASRPASSKSGPSSLGV